jgi:uncharacterized protein YecE (DUF72 family)
MLGMAARDFLGYYSQVFNAVEIDSTFYGAPRPETISRWAAMTPPLFKICLKMPRAITHDKSLVGVHSELDHFLRTVITLGDKLGVILLQFPPSFNSSKFDELDTLLDELPHGIRFAVEVRHSSWFTDRTERMLSYHGVAWCSMEYEALPRRVYRTANFLYIRLIGHHGSFKTHGSEKIDVTSQLNWWKANIQPHLSSIDSIYVFINNDYSGFAAGTLNRFKLLLGFEAKSLQQPGQPKLF